MYIVFTFRGQIYVLVRDLFSKFSDRRGEPLRAADSVVSQRVSVTVAVYFVSVVDVVSFVEKGLHSLQACNLKIKVFVF